MKSTKAAWWVLLPFRWRVNRTTWFRTLTSLPPPTTRPVDEPSRTANSVAQIEALLHCINLVFFRSLLASTLALSLPSLSPRARYFHEQEYSYHTRPYSTRTKQLLIISQLIRWRDRWEGQRGSRIGVRTSEGVQGDGSVPGECEFPHQPQLVILPTTFCPPRQTLNVTHDGWSTSKIQRPFL